MEGVRPELDIEVGTQEERANSVGNSAMGTLNRSILVGGISSSRPDNIPKLGEQAACFWVTIYLTTLIQVDIFVRATWGVSLQKVP